MAQAAYHALCHHAMHVRLVRYRRIPVTFYIKLCQLAAVAGPEYQGSLNRVLFGTTQKSQRNYNYPPILGSTRGETDP